MTRPRIESIFCDGFCLFLNKFGFRISVLKTCLSLCVSKIIVWFGFLFFSFFSFFSFCFFFSFCLMVYQPLMII